MRAHDNTEFEQFYSDLEQSLQLFEELEGSLNDLHTVAAQCSHRPPRRYTRHTPVLKPSPDVSPEADDVP